MKLGLAYFGGYDQQKVDLEKEMGLQYVISGATQLTPLPARAEPGEPLAPEEGVCGPGLTLSIIEGPTPLDKVKLGLPGAEEELEVFKDLLRNCAKLDIRTICYNWMPVLGWFRTRTDIPTRGGATVTGFDQRDMEGVADTWAGKVPQERLWQTLEAFLREIVPLCEELGVRLALHPDDPPVPSLRGIGRILTSAAAFDRVFSLYDSPMNGMTFCQGCFATMGEDIPAAIRHFGKMGKIDFVHFRDVQGDRTNFHETFHDDGKTDMYEAMRCYYEVGFDGIARPDHVPTMVGEDDAMPSYGLQGKPVRRGLHQGPDGGRGKGEWPALKRSARSPGGIGSPPGSHFFNARRLQREGQRNACAAPFPPEGGDPCRVEATCWPMVMT